MESRVTKKFISLRNEGKKALITYVTCGDPDLETTIDLVSSMEKAGADIVELGIPYSDPLADGPTIQKAAQRALQAGTNIDNIFSAVELIRKKAQIPLVFLVYYNAVFKYGMGRFLDQCTTKGVDGLIIPDLPLEERQELNQLMKDKPIDLIPLVAPTSGARIEKIVSEAKGFVYCISSKGVTGKRGNFEEGLADFMAGVRKHTHIPLAIGFGISDRKAVEKLKGLCDGLIVGSAIVERVEKGIDEGNCQELVSQFVSELHKGIR